MIAGEKNSHFMSKNIFNLSLLKPRYWPAWVSLGFLYLIIQLPNRIRMTLGKWLGKFLYWFPTRMKHTTEVNLKLCFPELSPKKQNELAKKNFTSLGIALIESATAWLLPNKKLQHLYQLYGYEYAESAFAKGKGIILITPHFTCVEMVARFIGMQNNFGILYRPHKKSFISYIHERFRKRHFIHYIPNNQIRQMLVALHHNKAIWYAYDIDAGEKHSVFAPFFGVPTATLTTVSRIARLSGAAIIPMNYYRRDDELGYDIILSPPLENFPTNDLLADATRLNAILEITIRQKPEQYIWQYKRFKTRPKGEKRFYYSSNFPPRRVGPTH